MKNKYTFALAALFFLCAIEAQTQEINIKDELWHCFATDDFNKESVLVALYSLTIGNEGEGGGRVKVAGIEHTAVFHTVGFNRE